MTGLITTTVIVAVIFGVLWYTGQLTKFRDYWNETVEELKKCSRPTWNELKGSTVVVMISIAILAIFTIAADFLFAWLVNAVT